MDFATPRKLPSSHCLPALPPSLPPSVTCTCTVPFLEILGSQQLFGLWLTFHRVPPYLGDGDSLQPLVCRKDPGVHEECPGPPLSWAFLLSLAVKVEGYCSPPSKVQDALAGAASVVWPACMHQAFPPQTASSFNRFPLPLTRWRQCSATEPLLKCRVPLFAA